MTQPTKEQIEEIMKELNKSIEEDYGINQVEECIKLTWQKALEQDKIHFFILKDKKIRYICNQACVVTQGKYTNDYFEVTCKNCKEMLTKDRIALQVKKAQDEIIDKVDLVTKDVTENILAWKEDIDLTMPVENYLNDMSDILKLLKSIKELQGKRSGK